MKMGSEVIRQQLEDLFKQMLLVFAKESTALKQLSGKSCGDPKRLKFNIFYFN